MQADRITRAGQGHRVSAEGRNMFEHLVLAAELQIVDIA
jgi:hypothetical protein